MAAAMLSRAACCSVRTGRLWFGSAIDKAGDIGFQLGVPEARSNGIDKHKIGFIRQALEIVRNFVGSRRSDASVNRHDAAGPTEPMCSHTDEEPGPPL